LGLVTNCYLTNEAWFQAALPVRLGGLVVRGISTLASSAFLASVASVQVFATSLLPPQGAVPLSGMVTRAEAEWFGRGGSGSLIPTNSTSQKAWDNVICSKQFETLMASGSDG